MLFDPFELDTSVTPGRVREALRQEDFTRAILMALRLNESKLVQEALEAVPRGESESGLWCQAPGVVLFCPGLSCWQNKHVFFSFCS